MACQDAMKLFCAYILLKLSEVFGLWIITMRLTAVGSYIDPQYIRMAFWDVITDFVPLSSCWIT